MCGIAGLLLKRPADDLVSVLSALGDRLAHRGPDDRGVLQFSETSGVIAGREPAPVAQCRAGLVHRRLAIFDPSPAAAQPMSTADGRLHLIFNGAIYNYVELRDELTALGHTFRSHGDTEVLLAALAHWGAAALPRLVGMFALALLDTAKRTLLLARDPFGIKPLYYATTDNGLGFASEQKALLAVPGVDRRVDPQRLFDYLRWGLTDFGSATMLRGIAQVEPGSWLEYSWDKPAQPTNGVYWQPQSAAPVELSFDAATERLRELFLDSIRLHLRSDVPLGAALSGGIDSSAIVCAMRRLAGAPLDLHTFCYVADDAAINEERHARAAAAAAAATLHPVQAGPEDLAQDLDALIDSQDEPFGSTSIFAQRAVFRAAHAQGLKVMLDGQGGDELLGGYRYFIAGRAASLIRSGRLLQAARLLKHANALPASGHGPAALLHALGLLLPPPLRNTAMRLCGIAPTPPWLNAEWFAERGVRIDPPRQAAGPRYLTEQLMISLQHTSLPALLRYEDRNSMAFGIESRVPFLTTKLVEFAFGLPEDYIIGPDGTPKRLLRHALRGLVPDEILDRRDKIGFATPEAAWLASLRDWMTDTLQSEAAATIPALRPAEMLSEWNAQLAGRRPFDFRFWRWANLIRWADRRGVIVSE
jgi:asparagine synthase (glutamine-hydrolysing)